MKDPLKIVGQGAALMRVLAEARDLRMHHGLLLSGARGTGKSHIYKEISPNSILISGGQTTVANLFYEDSTRTRLSFETAAKRLGADTMTFSVAASCRRRISLSVTRRPAGSLQGSSSDRAGM